MRISDWSSDVCSSDLRLGRFVNEEGRIAPGLYCVGWARRGPTGTIGTNRPDGFAIAELIAADAPSGTTEGRPGLDRLIAARGLKVVTFQDWKKIDAAEIARARYGSPREKFTSRSEEHTSELQSLMRISYAVFCLK